MKQLFLLFLAFFFGCFLIYPLIGLLDGGLPLGSRLMGQRLGDFFRA